MSKEVKALLSQVSYNISEVVVKMSAADEDTRSTCLVWNMIDFIGHFGGTSVSQ